MPRFWNGLVIPHDAMVPGMPPVERLYSTDLIVPEDYEPPYQLDYAASSLTQIADHFKTDKGSIKHRYTAVYSQYLDAMRNEPLRLLEIGVACGCSLKTWAKYLPNAQVVGVDIRPECASLCAGYPSIQIRVADARSIPIPGAFDIIVDDGSHISADIVETLQAQWPSLAPGGLYFIEDLKCTHSAEYAAAAKPAPTAERAARSAFTGEIDRILQAMDDGTSSVKWVHFHPQLAVLKKS